MSATRFDRVCLWLDARWSVVNPATCFGGVYALVIGVSLAIVVSPWFLLLLLLVTLAVATNLAAFHGQTLRLDAEDRVLFAEWREQGWLR